MRKLQANKSPVTSVFQSMESLLDYASVALTGVEDGCEFTSDDSLQLAIVFVYVQLWKSMLLPCAACSPHVTGPCDCALYSGDPS